MRTTYDHIPMLERVFDDVMRSAFGTATTAAQGYTPAIDVRADQARVVFHCDLPGVRREDLSLTLEGGVLTIKGQRKYQAGPEGEKVWLGRHYGAFSRSFSLPDGLDEAGLAAELADGVLTITVPKSPRAKPRRIEIRAGAEAKQLDASPEAKKGQGGG